MSRARRGRGVAVAAVVVVAAGAAAGGLVAAGDDDPGPSAGADAPATASRRTATVERRDLVDTTEADGTLGHGDATPVRGAGAGTITALPAAGTVIDHDQPLYDVDGHDGPVLLPGSLPAWRTLEVGVDDGTDVAQLELALVALGYADAEDLTVDESFTGRTREAVEDWQEAHGLEETGRVEPGAVWFGPEPVRVAATTLTAGDPAQGEVLTVTGTGRVVQVDLDVADSQGVAVGDPVDLELADGSTVEGTVSEVAAVATVTPASAQEEATTTVAVEITPAGRELAVPDQSPVTVAFVRDAVEDALAVPVEAVVAVADGGVALEVVDTDGATRMVEVELGREADGWVQVTGSVSEGQTVVTA